MPVKNKKIFFIQKKFFTNIFFAGNFKEQKFFLFKKN